MGYKPMRKPHFHLGCNRVRWKEGTVFLKTSRFSNRATLSGISENCSTPVMSQEMTELGTYTSKSDPKTLPIIRI